MSRPTIYNDWKHQRVRIRLVHQKDFMNFFPGAVCAICKEETENLEVHHSWLPDTTNYFQVSFICKKCKYSNNNIIM